MTEHDIQSAFVQYVRIRAHQVPELEWLHAIPNGGARNAVTGARMKAEGALRGVWDVCWPCPIGPFKGLYIEFKFGKNKLTLEQKAFGEFVESQGYKTGIAYTVDEGITILENYLQGADQSCFQS